MPKVTWLKEFDGQLWARLELDGDPSQGPVFIMTKDEIKQIKIKERKKWWDEIKSATHSIDEDYD